MLHAPPREIRRHVVEALADFYQEHDLADFREALGTLCAYYGISKPKIRWRRQIEKGRTLGLTHPDDNMVELIHPRWWARRKADGWREYTEREWVHVVLHEFAHVLSSVDEEAKADHYATRMVEEA